MPAAQGARSRKARTALPVRRGEKRALQIADVLRARIVQNAIAVDAPLPIESELQVEFGVSRFTIREAMRVLEFEGFVELRRGAGGGPRVRHPAVAFAAQAMGIQLQLLEVPLLHVWQTRTDIVVAALQRLAAAPPPEEEIARLFELVDELATVQADVAAYPRAWVNFTEELVRLSGNAASDFVVRALHELTENQLRESAARSDSDEANRFRAMVARSCRRLVTAIADGDVDAALKEFLRQSDAKSKGMARVLGDEATALDVFGDLPR